MLERLDVANEPRPRQQQVAMDAAYGGRLSLGELVALRTAGLIPYYDKGD